MAYLRHSETPEQMVRDSDMIFKQITMGDFPTLKEAPCLLLYL
ncbi:hypothetical protein LCGC14_2540790, partial [marine sediment metagenome]